MKNMEIKAFEKAAFIPAGDSALYVRMGYGIDPDLNGRVRAMVHLLENEPIEGIIEWIPGYCTLMVVYDPLIISYRQLIARLQELEERKDEIVFPPPLVIEIPTTYGTENREFGPDLQSVADHTKLSPENVVELHCSVDYLIYMIGFTPGFSFLGGMAPQLETPRLENPREKVPAGSVGIAGPQTGIYPIESPGGWRLIGRTPVKLFDPERDEPILLKAGYYIRFMPISSEDYINIAAAAEENRYQVNKYPLEGKYSDEG
jgi:inhibitor of KinA